MFSIIKNGTNIGYQTGVMAHYTINRGAISVYYDKADEFNASLDMLSDDQGKFCSLIFTFHNKTNITQPNTISMSILKRDGNALCFRLFNSSTDTFLFNRISEASTIITELERRCADICINRARSEAY